ncbi:MAG: hypothetical protein K6L81_02050 [Agarilytica sp.]
MNIYQITFDVDNYRLLVPVSESDFDGSNLWINGTLKLSSWRAPEMRYAEKQGDSEDIADITQITPGFFAFSPKAIEALGDLLEKNGELFELPVDGVTLHAFNPHNEIDCFDENNASYKVRRSGERGRLLKPAFDKSKIPAGTDLFQVPELQQTQFFVGERFKGVVEGASLTGLNFEMV